jgi:exodeoxyribonuclease VII small subunit
VTEEAVHDVPIETLLADLEALATELEGGELQLEQALTRFEHGMGMVRQARRILDAAERRLEELLAETDDGPITRELSTHLDADDPNPTR